MQNKTPLADLLCSMDKNVIDAMSLIDKNSKGILFVTDRSGHFLGTITDGDIRRGVLSSRSLDFTIEKLINKDSLTARQGEPDDVIEQKIKALKSNKSIKIVPILHHEKCVDYYESEPHFFVPISAPVLLGNELNYVHDCVTSGWISSQGSYVTRFENYFSQTYKAGFSVSVMNATCGLHLALKALNIGDMSEISKNQDEVILPSFTFAATINAVLHAGAKPVMVDVRDDWCIDPTAIEKAITPQTKAIIPVHLYGQVCDMDAIMALAKKYNLKVIEDCAEAQGATLNGRFVGTFGDIGCFSFFANKIMTTGEGGMNTTQNAALNEKMRKLRDHGKNPNHFGYYHDEIGFNFRMTNIQAAIGVAQMEKIEALCADRNRIKLHYHQKLKDTPGLVSQYQFQQKGVTPVCWLVSYVLDDKINRDAFVLKLKEKGIDARPFFMPMHEMPLYQKYTHGSLSVSERLGRQGINLPTGSYMNGTIIDQVVEEIKMTLKEVAR